MSINQKKLWRVSKLTLAVATVLLLASVSVWQLAHINHNVAVSKHVATANSIELDEQYKDLLQLDARLTSLELELMSLNHQINQLMLLTDQ